MTEQTLTVVHSSETADTLYRPEDIQEMFGIKKVAYYNRLKYLRIEAQKDEQGKPYLNSEQVELLQALHEHINETGKMEGFMNNAIVKVDDSAAIASTNNNPSENIYVQPAEPTAQFEMNQLMRSAAELKAREIAMPELVKRAIADKMTDTTWKVSKSREI